MKSDDDPFVTRKINRASLIYFGFKILIQSITAEKNQSHPRAATVVTFELTSKKTTYRFNAGAIGVKQSGRYLDIESIYLDRLDLEPEIPAVTGKVALLAKDFNSRLPIELVFAVPALTPKAGRTEIHRLTVSSGVAPNPGRIAKRSTAVEKNTLSFPTPSPSPSILPSPTSLPVFDINTLPILDPSSKTEKLKISDDARGK